MQKVYALWKVYPFAGPSHILALYSSKAIADNKKDMLAQAEDNKPEYDSYGLCGGVDYVVEEFTLDEDAP